MELRIRGTARTSARSVPTGSGANVPGCVVASNVGVRPMGLASQEDRWRAPIYLWTVKLNLMGKITRFYCLVSPRSLQEPWRSYALVVSTRRRLFTRMF